MSAHSFKLFLVLCLLLITPVVTAKDYTLPDACVVDLVDDIELHATEAGILDRVTVREGARVRAEDVLVQIDTQQPEIALEVAEHRWRAANERASDDVEERYATKAAEAAKANMEEMEEVVGRVEKAITEADMRQGKLEFERAALQIEKAQHDRKLAGLEAKVQMAEFKAAQMAIERRTLRAPFDGIVIQQFRNEREWVNPGEPILRLVRLDELQVEGLVPISSHAPADLDGCEVTVTVEEVGGGREFQATGRIVYIHPILYRGQKVAVRAEVTNREENGDWVMKPKMTAKMTIHLGTGGVAAAQR